MQNSSEFQYIAIDTIHESATNPRRTFDEAKLQELAESIRTNGLIQPITFAPTPKASRSSRVQDASELRKLRKCFPYLLASSRSAIHRRSSGSW